MPAPKGNDFAKKAARDLADNNIQIRCKSSAKKRWKQAALLRHKRDPRIKNNLSQWVLDALNAEAEYETDLAKKAKQPGKAQAAR
jgi:hypothetical protein